MHQEINIGMLFILLTLHWICDFVLQTDKQAKGKSNNWSDLLAHTGSYTLGFFAAYCLAITITLPHDPATFNLNLLWFFPITFICHTATDYYTSRINAELWKDKRLHDFFVSIGFDQLLHIVQLVLTYQLVS